MQELIQGEHSIQKAIDKISHLGYKTVFLITGSHFQPDDKLVFPVSIKTHHWKKKGANVEKQEIEAAFKQFQNNPPEVILAIGGGSVMDLAKSIIYHCTRSSTAAPFFIAAPTTAGSGSEATHFAVIYEDKTKRSLVHHQLLPNLVVLDPELTYSLSPYQTAVSGMDALSQAVESYWNVYATDESRRYASEAIALWKKYFLTAVRDPASESRQAMLQAAHLAGKAINITRTTGPHALSYFLTANFNIPHGQSVALFLPVFFLYNEPLDELCVLLEVKNGTEAKQYIQKTMKDAGLAIGLGELGIDKKAIADALLNEVNEERFANNPAAFDREKLKDIIITHL